MNTRDDSQQEDSGRIPIRKLLRVFRSGTAQAGLAVGVAVFAVVIGLQGISDVRKAFAGAGWWIVAIALFHLPPLWADAMGWRSLITSPPQPTRRAMIAARWIGESINDLLPVLQMGGNVVRVWLMAGRGVPVARAGASVVIDVTLIVLTQIIFTLFGLGLLVPTIGGGKTRLLVFIGTAIMALLLGGFYAAQRRGLFGVIVRISERVLGGAGSTGLSSGAATIDGDVMRLYSERKALAASGCWHMLAWFLGVGEIWFALRLFGHPVGLGTAFLFESLGQAIRTGAFAVPGALGIQEGGYILAGGILGIPPGASLALSLARRLRELLLGLPGLAFWQASDIGSRLRKRRSGVAAAASAQATPGGETLKEIERKP